MCPKLFIGVAFILIGYFSREISSVPLSVSSLDENKRVILGEFLSLVGQELPHQYMKDDTYLLRFLSYADFNLKEAASLLKENLAFREAEKVDSIMEEDFSDYELRFPYQLDSVNRNGLPVLYKPFGQWNVSSVIANGEETRFFRYISLRMLEEADRKLRSMMRKDSDVAQFDIITNMDGVSKENHGCLQCRQLMLKVFLSAETHFGGAIDNFFYVNSGPKAEPYFRVLVDSLKYDMSKQSVKVLGGREAYEPVLLQHIAKEELPLDLQ